MSANWTLEQINALAPDAASLKAAQKLTSSSKWPLLEHNPQAIWGHCQGSGKNPYQTRIDLSEPAFKCSCPSRKFPCKHGLALFTLYVDSFSAFSEKQQAPEWVQEWLDSRGARKAKKIERENKPPDPAAQAKRQAKREDKVTRGVEELGLWLQDLVRNGFADLPDKPYKFWDEIRARMVDAQAPGLANRVEQLANTALSGARWAERLTQAVGELHLLLQAYQRIDTLEPDLQADIRSLIGWSQSKEEVMQTASVEDDWAVLSNHMTQNGTLLVQRIWLHGQTSQHIALLLNFAHENNRSSLALGLLPAKIAYGSLYFYPGSVPLRVLSDDLSVNLNVISDIQQLFGAKTIDAALDQYHAAILRNPWLRQYPLLCHQVRIVLDAGALFVLDSNSKVLPIHSNFSQRWQLLALSGGHAMTLFGEWDGYQLMPLGVLNEQGYSTLLNLQETA